MDNHIERMTGISVLRDLASVSEALAGDAERLDAEAEFPWRALAALRDAGGLRAPVPAEYGGSGLGTEGRGAEAIYHLLSAIGHANLSLGRVFEAHVNALRLICRYGNPAQIARAGADACAGHLFGLWITDQPGNPVTLADGVLRGQKGFASSAGAATRALISCMTGGEERLAMIDLTAHEATTVMRFDLHGVRSAATARLDLTGIPVTQDNIIGAAGDYIRQPELSLGAWRALAVMLGGMKALAEAIQQALIARRRDADPHQRARLGRAFVALETATLWVRRCALLAEADDAGEDAANYVKLARVAFEQSCIDVIQLAQRSVGIAAMVKPNRIEQLCRDLTMYLRQPALDEVLDEAAEYFTGRRIP